MTANLAPYLDSVSVKVLINGIDISASVTDVDFNGEYKINDVTTFGYGVSAQNPGGGSRWSPSIDVSTFTLSVLYNQKATTVPISVALTSPNLNAYTYTGNPQLWSVLKTSIAAYLTAAIYFASGEWLELTDGTLIQPGTYLGIGVSENCTWTFTQIISDGIQGIFLSLGSGGVPTGAWNSRSKVPFIIGPAGNDADSGNTIITGNCYAPKFNLVGKVGNAVTAKIEFKVDGGAVCQQLNPSTVTFDANGGTGTMTAQSASVPTALTTNTFTRTGYTFAGWNTNAGGTGTAYADGASYPFTADATLYAQWTLIPTLVSISLAPTSTTIAIDEVQEYVLTGHYSDSSEVDITDQITGEDTPGGVSDHHSVGYGEGVLLFVIGTSAGTGDTLNLLHAGFTSNTVTITVTGPS